MPDYDNTNTGVLFPESEVQSDRHPTHTGKLNVEGKEYRIAAWPKTSKSGEFFSLAISEPKPKEEGGGYEKAKAQRDALAKQEVTDLEMEQPISLSDIPF